MKPLILFDCFGVIYDEIAPIVLKRYYGEEIKDAIRRDLFPLLDEGKMSLEEGFAKMVERYGGKVEDLIALWKEGTRLRPEMAEFIRKHHDEFRYVLISNAPKGVVEKEFATNSIGQYFEGVYSSSAIHLMKPNPEFFRLVLSAHAKEGDAVYFIDDTKANFSLISSLPIRCIWFRGMESLEELFRR